LFTKKDRYYFDHEAIAEATVDGSGKKNKRSVWTVPVRAFREAHFATFPVELIEPCVLAGTSPGDVVLDPFSGAGTTGVAALRHGRRYLGIEINAEYMRMANERLAEEARRSRT